MAWFALAVLASVVPVVRWWAIARRRALFAGKIEMVLPVAGNGPTALVAQEVARALHRPEAPVAAIIRRDGLRISLGGTELGTFRDQEPATMTELVAVAAEFAATHGSGVRRLVIDVGLVEPGVGPATAAYARGARLAVIVGLPATTADQQRLLAALCPEHGVLVTSETDLHRLETIAEAASDRNAVVVAVEAPPLSRLSPLSGRPPLSGPHAEVEYPADADVWVATSVARSVAIALGYVPSPVRERTPLPSARGASAVVEVAEVARV